MASSKIRKSRDQNQHLKDAFSKVSVDKLPSVFKMSLAQFFSKSLDQELPDIDGVSINLFSKTQLKMINFRLLNKTDKIRILFKLLQCKDLAAEVPGSMTLEAYKKHRSVLSTVRNTPHEVLQQVRLYAKQFAQSVKSYYENVVPIAPTTAPYESTRSAGGSKKVLEPKLVFNKPIRIKTITRIDPVVIHLIGEPGLGKSYLSEHLIHRLANHFSIEKTQARYSRSMACEHWDGYRGQLIAQIDDIFTERDGTEDFKQLIQMCSNAKWIVPMADLKEKGTEFNSEFLLLSSNHRPQDGMYINCEQAVDRRVYNPAYRLVSFNKKTKIYEVEKVTRHERLFTIVERIQGDCEKIVSKLFNDAISLYDRRLESLESIDGKSYRKTFIPVTKGTEFNYRAGYEFDPCPTSLPRVKAHAIPEPLKVRMITKGEAQNWLLKPLQRAMHSALKDFPCFRLTSGQCILNNFKPVNSNMFFISGDYSAATDNLNMDIMATVVDELIQVLPAWLIPYVLRESGPHIIEYPSHSNLDPVLQTNGQLMGSLLSFPILCVANAATYGLAINNEDLTTLPCLINGDDIAFRDYKKVIRRWKKFATSMGLQPSVGKNYMARDWFTINSQLVLCGQNSNKLTITDSEGFNVLWSHKAQKGEINTLREASKRFDKKLIVTCLKNQLKQTPRSLDISTSFGGLGKVNTRKPTKMDMEINLMSYLDTKTKVLAHVDEFTLVQCSKEVALKYATMDETIVGYTKHQYPPETINFVYKEKVPTYKEMNDVELDQKSPWLEFQKLNRFCKFYKTVPALREFVKQGQLLNIKNTQMVTLWVHRDIYEQMPKHSFIDLKSLI
jgi:hypothetical protein